MNERLVVRPRVWKLLLTVLGALAFTGVGICLISTGDVVPVIAGLFSIAFFGGGTLLVLVRGMRNGMSQMTLDPQGLHTRSGGTVAWEDIEAVGHDPGSGGMVWIRLRDPDRYLAGAPAQANSVIRRFLLPFAAVLGALGIGSLRRYAGRVRTHADEVRWNRETFGWDLAWSTMWLDRPGDRFVELLERYRREAAS